jgi:hypothetical protein
VIVADVAMAQQWIVQQWIVQQWIVQQWQQHTALGQQDGRATAETATPRPPPTPDPPDRDGHTPGRIHDVPHKRLQNA